MTRRVVLIQKTQIIESKVRDIPQNMLNVRQLWPLRHKLTQFPHLMLLQAVSFDLTSLLENQGWFADQTAKPPVPADLPRGERGRGRGNAIRQGWCGPQAQPRTRPCLIGLPEGEGSALSLTARGVWLVQFPLAQETRATEPLVRSQLLRTALNRHSPRSRMEY